MFGVHMYTMPQISKFSACCGTQLVTTADVENSALNLGIKACLKTVSGKLPARTAYKISIQI